MSRQTKTCATQNMYTQFANGIMELNLQGIMFRYLKPNMFRQAMFRQALFRQ